MVREFKLPDVGEGLTEAEIVNWLVEPGDTVTEDQPVAEVETDKAVVEVPAPVNGTVREILAEEGEMVPVGTVIITFDVEGEEPEPEPTEPEEAPASEPGEPEAEIEETSGRVFAAPSARRLARELGVSIGAVEGSGPGGRVTEADVREAAEASAGEEATEEAASEAESEVKSATRKITADEGEAELSTDTDGTEAATSGGSGAASVESADRERTLAAPSTRKLAEEKGVDLDAVPTERTKDGEPFVTDEQVREYAEAQQQAQAADAEAVSGAEGGAGPEIEATGEDERIPYRGVRRTIGKQMEKSKFTAPHVTHHDDVDVTRLVETRGRLKEKAEARDTKLTYMPFVVKAIVAALKEHPILNAQLDEENEEIVVRGDYNIGVATATDAGLMVPVVKGADRKGMLDIADEMRDLIEKARNRDISREEMQDGTFTITNFGAIGGEYATPIINYPESAILGLGAIKDKPRVVDGEVVPRKVMTLSLSIDHRVIDGADAARFVNTVKEYLENPELLLLE
ncbi:2-oxo acid dehydrogenase subunit E2 [Natronomonas halophila]|uniref:dihydrolipoamide acetyltransferase family protein n=1 Tax=Natronomonas halophila TaxID=2747817 RepID=UPI0015B4BB7A|nr:dihydrolipoamide acetyltransferase family protein [Natronomonas halophila]QLD86265.1 2-oxo acid dehydrogenase subunit E2 [Natronomonas halophila]